MKPYVVPAMAAICTAALPAAPPPAADPEHPTAAELAAVRSHLAKIQEVFETH